MSLLVRSALGYSGSPIHFCSSDEIVWVCGNVLTVYKLGGTQRILRGSSFGIACFTTSRHHGLIAFAENGPIPSVRIHRLSDLEFVGAVNPNVELEIAALAFSSDGMRLAVCSAEPELSLSIYEWKQGDLLATTSLPLGATATQVSFHPYNANLLCTSGDGSPLEWRLEKLWGRYDISHAAIEIPYQEGLGATTCHSWFSGGLYLGFSTGHLLSVDIQPSVSSPQHDSTSPSPPGSAPSGMHQNIGLAAAYDAPQPSLKRPPIIILATGSTDSPVTTISVGRDHVAVAAGAEPVVKWFSHAYPPSHMGVFDNNVSSKSFKEKAVHMFGTSEYGSVIGLTMGGEGFDVTAVGLSDGTVRLLGASNEGGDAKASVEEVIVEAHAGAIHALATHPSQPGRFLSCGSDGVLRVWEIVGAQYQQQQTKGGNVRKQGINQTPAMVPTIAPKCIDRRTFSSAQTALAASSTHLLAAVGSEGGVVRIISLEEVGGPRPLSVVFRRRLHSSSVIALAFSPDGQWLASAGKDGAVSFISIMDGAASPLVIGYITCPDPILNLVWPVISEGEDCVLVTLASGAVLSASVPEELSKAHRSSRQAGMQLGKESSVKVVKLETALLCASGLTAGLRYGELVGLGADKMLHRVPLPMEGQAWGGLKGRVSKSSIRMNAHEAAMGCVAVSSPNALTLATASADGHVSCHVAATLVALGSTTNTGLGPIHDATKKGAACVAVDLSGRWLMSAGLDGSMFMLEALLPPTLSPTAPSSPPQAISSKLDVDSFDEPEEPTEAEYYIKKTSHSTHNVEQGLSSSHPTGSAGGSKLESLRERLKACILKNEAADELEKLSKNDLIIDQALASDLKALADIRVISVQENLKKEHLRLELVAHRVKKVCYEEMTGQKGVKVTSMKTGLEVHNFPLVKLNEKLLQKMATLRLVELAELAEDKRAGENDFATGVLASENSLYALPSMSHGVSGAQDGTAVAPEGEGKQALDYSDLELHGQMRKTSQMIFFRQQVHEVQAAFNAELDTVMKLKQSEADRILDLNARIDETLKDLIKIGGSATDVERFIAPFPENMKHILEVKDSEIAVEKFASADSAKASEEDGGKGKVGGKEGNLADRALKQMMGGTLASKVEEGDPFALERPPWMDGNPKLFGEDQLRALREFQSKERSLNEERAKRISALESELRSLRVSVEDAANKFDDHIQGLLTKKVKALSQVKSLEARIVSLSAAIDLCQRTGDSAEREEFLSLSAHGDARTKATQDLNERRTLLNEAELKATEIAGEERTLDRNFKREFGETEELYSKLLQIYRYRDGDALPSARPGHLRDEGVKVPVNKSPSMNRVPSMPNRVHSNPPGKTPATSGLNLLAPSGMRGMPHLPSSNLADQALHAREATLRDVASHTLDPFPPLPSSCLDHHDPFAAEDAIIAAAMTGSHHKPNKSHLLDDSLCPEGLDAEWWFKFVQYRAKKMQCEAELGFLTRRIHLLFKDVTKLEGDEKKHGALVDERMAAVQAIRKERHLAVHDTALQLKVKAGQVEASPPSLVSSDLSFARLLHRSVVEEINEAVSQRGDKKVEVMVAIKDFKKGIYQLEWEHKKCDLMVDELREKTKELQMLHVTRELQSVFRSSGAPAAPPTTTSGRGGAGTGLEGGPSSDYANLEALGRQREINQKKLLLDRQRKLQKVAKLIEEKRQQNEDVSRHLVTLEKVLEEQERLRTSMQTMEDQNSRRMRSMVTHKKLKDIAGAQRAELQALTSHLETLRLRTFPTFVDNASQALPPDTRMKKNTGGWN